MCRRRLFNGASGRHCKLYLTARPVLIARLRKALANPLPLALWRMPAPPTPSLLPFPAIVSCAKTATWAAIAGARRANNNCWSKKQNTFCRGGGGDVEGRDACFVRRPLHITQPCLYKLTFTFF